jgi:phytoene desaturase
LVNYPWVFDQLFQRAGTCLADYVALRLVTPSLECHWPSEPPLRLTSGLADMVHEIERWEGHAAGWAEFMRVGAERFDVAFTHLVTRNAHRLWSWVRGAGVRRLAPVVTLRTLDGELRRFFHHPRVRDALGAYAMYLGGSPYQLPGLYSIIPYGELAFGLWWPEGGIVALVRAIEQLARRVGVEIVTNCAVRQIETDGAQVRGVICEDGSRIAAKVVVSNVDVPTTWQRLLGRPRAMAERLNMTLGVVTVYWGIHRQWSGHPHAIFFPTDTRRCYEDLFRRHIVPEEVAFYACLQSRLQPDRAPPGHTALFVLVPVPTLRHVSAEQLRRRLPGILGQVRGRLAAHGWQWAESDVVVEQIWTPADWAERLGLFDGSAFGASHGWSQIGPFRPPNRDPYVRGLYYVGASTTPGTGLPLVVLSGQMTSERIQKDFA